MTERVQGKHISLMAPGARITITKVDPCGSLYAKKKMTGAVMLYWRYTQADYAQLIEIGLYDSSAPPKSTAKSKFGYSLVAATREAEELARIHQTNKPNGGFREVQQKAIAKKKQNHEIETLNSQQTLGILLLSYCDYLEKNGRKAHKDARNIFKKDVISAWPKVAELPASKVTSEQIADILRRIHESGHPRTSNKLRSYMRAAYQVAKSAKNKASIPANFKSFQITHNPAADTEPDASANRSDKNPLTISELQTYWHIIKGTQGFKGAVLRLHLLTGGLRIEQLVNLKAADVNGDHITLFDIKGRTGSSSPRPYVTPLIEKSKQALAQCKSTGVYALSLTGGKTHISASTLSKWSCEVVDAKIPNFAAKRIRSGVETLLARQKFSKDLRGRLQSHGIAGVQDKHYDGYDYVDEKREMLETLFNVLNEDQT
jgi:integrase